MKRLRTACLAPFLLLEAVACGSPSAPSGPLADIKTVAAKQQTGDLAYQTFLAGLKLDSALVDQLQASRAAVNEKVQPVKLTSLAARSGRVQQAPTGVFMVLFYASTLADALDPMTAGRSAGGQMQAAPYQSMTAGTDTTTTTVLNTTMNLSGAGSRVTLTMHWTYTDTTTRNATGERVLQITDDRTIVGSIDVCPNASGSSPATVDVHVQLSKTGAGGSASSLLTSSNVFTGRVDDQAVLRGVTQDLQQTASWENGSGAGGYQFNGNGFSWQGGASGFGDVSATGAQGSVKSNGSATNDQVSKEAGGTMAIDKAAIDPAFTQAQKLWRNGRCVVVQAPDYSAETPLAVDRQTSVQHDEKVDTDSKTKFAVRLKLRFGGSLAQPVKASLSGEKKLDPTTLEAGSGSLTYTAPAEQDKQATVTLKSVSRRGIGTLVIEFHTSREHLKLTASGKVTVTPQSADILTLQWNVSIGPADFHQVGDNTYEAVAPATGQGGYVNFPIPGCPIAFTETASITFMATLENRGGKSVWVVRMDQDRSSATLTVSSCAGGATGQLPTGGYVVQALNDVGPVTIPIDGGTVTQTGSRPIPGQTGSATLTFVATVNKE